MESRILGFGIQNTVKGIRKCKTLETGIGNRESTTWNLGSKTYMGRKIGSVISPPPRFHRFIKLWEYCPPFLPRKKGKRKKQTNKQRYKQKNKQNKTENKNRKYTHLTLRNLPKHCDVCRIIFYHVVTLLLARGCQKRDNEVLQRDFVFP